MTASRYGFIVDIWETVARGKEGRGHQSPECTCPWAVFQEREGKRMVKGEREKPGSLAGGPKVPKEW